MAHELFNSRFFGFREPAWHKLGATFDDAAMTAVRAIEEGGLDYAVTKHPITVGTPWGELETGKVALVREPVADDPQPRVFATSLDKDYGLLQNRQIAEMLEDVSKEWPVETVGALGFGERIFITLRLGAMEVGGSEVGQYFMVNEAKDGTGAINIKYCTTRVVCANTLSMALSDGLDTVKLTHTAEVADRMKFEIQLMAALKRAGTDARESLTDLAATVVTDAEVQEVFAAAFPNPKKPRPFRFANLVPDAVGSDLYMREHKRSVSAQGEWQNRVNRLGEFREAATELYAKLNDEFPAAAGTAWHALNAVTELADHRGNGVDESSERFAKSEYDKAHSAIFGSRAAEKSAALVACMELARRAPKPAPKLISLPV